MSVIEKSNLSNNIPLIPAKICIWGAAAYRILVDSISLNVLLIEQPKSQ